MSKKHIQSRTRARIPLLFILLFQLGCMMSQTFSNNSADEKRIIKCIVDNLSINEGLKPVWSTSINGMPGKPLVISNETGFLVSRQHYYYGKNSFGSSTPSNKDQLIAFDVPTGEIKWTFPGDSSTFGIQYVHASGEYVGMNRWVDKDHSESIPILSSRDGSLIRDQHIEPLDMLVSPHHLFLRDVTRATRNLGPVCPSIWDDPGGKWRSKRPKNGQLQSAQQNHRVFPGHSGWPGALA